MTKSKIMKAIEAAEASLKCVHVLVESKKPSLAGAITKRCKKCKTTFTTFPGSETRPKLKGGVRVRAATKKF